MIVSELGRRLQLHTASLWLDGASGDPYARLLRGFDERPFLDYERIRRQGPLVTSRTRAWVTADYQVGRELIVHPDLVFGDAGEFPAAQQVLPAGVILPGGSAGALPVPDRSVVARMCARVLAGRASELDLKADIVDPIVLGVLAELLGMRDRLDENWAALSIALDGLLCPQPLTSVRRLLIAVEDLRDVPGGVLAAVAASTAANLTAHCLLALLEHPAEWARLVADPGHAARAVDETLRYDPPVHLDPLVARRDVEICGQRVAAGTQVVVIIGAANRDPAVFAAPDRFAPAADRKPLLPGGLAGLVGEFSRTQAEVVVAAVAERLPRLRRSGAVLRRRRSPVTRSLLRFPVSTLP